MPSRTTLLMALTTAPTDRGAASPHSGGWSESWWTAATIPATAPSIRELAQIRATLLPKQASVIGFRVSNYTIVGNKVNPTGSATGKFQYPGSASLDCDLPQVALEISASGFGVANKSRFTLRGMPDVMMVNGEYQPTPAFKRLVTLFCGHLRGAPYCFLGRDLTQPSQRVQSITGNTVVLAAAIGAVVGTDFMRFSHVTDVNGKPISGSYRIVDFAAPATYTVVGLENKNAVNSGTARVDKVSVIPFGTVEPSRAVVRKIGRPFESYRGRGSKR